MSEHEALWIGIDVGTQSVKAKVIGNTGSVHASASSPLTSRHELWPHGNRHEQDPEQWVSVAHHVLERLVHALDPVSRRYIAGIAVCATSGSIAVVDGTGRPVSTGIMYDDARAGTLSREVTDAEPELWNELGLRMQPTWALPKILWLKRNGFLAEHSERQQPSIALHPDRFVAHQADVVTSSLVGHRVASDWSHSLKSGYDLLRRTWPHHVLDVLGLSSDELPDVVAPGTLLGSTSAQLTASTGIAQGTPVYAGMTDGCAAQLGAAAVTPGDSHVVIGTTLVIKTVSANLVSDDSGAVYSHLSPDGDHWLPGGASNLGAGILARLFPETDLTELTRSLEEQYETDSYEALPFSYPLPGTGERFPIVAPAAHGFVRMRQQEYTIDEAVGKLGERDAFAAVLVGVACAERLALDRLARAGVPTSGTISSSGGGTTNPWWTQLRADLLGREITVSATADGSTGMAVLAAWASRRHQTPPHVPTETLSSVAAQMSRSDKTYRPNPERKEQLEMVYGAFIQALVDKKWISE